MTDLNQKYFDLFSDLYICREVLPKKQYTRMEDALMSSYKRELDKLIGAEILKCAPGAFTLKLQLKHYIPRCILFFRNKAARELRRRHKKELRLHLEEMRCETDQLSVLTVQKEDISPVEEDSEKTEK